MFMQTCLYMFVCMDVCVRVYIWGQYRYCFPYTLNLKLILSDQWTMGYFAHAFHGSPYTSGTLTKDKWFISY